MREPFKVLEHNGHDICISRKFQWQGGGWNNRVKNQKQRDYDDDYIINIYSKRRLSAFWVLDTGQTEGGMIVNMRLIFIECLL